MAIRSIIHAVMQSVINVMLLHLRLCIHLMYISQYLPRRSWTYYTHTFVRSSIFTSIPSSHPRASRRTNVRDRFHLLLFIIIGVKYLKLFIGIQSAAAVDREQCCSFSLPTDVDQFSRGLI